MTWNMVFQSCLTETKQAKALVSKNIKIMNFGLDVVHINVTKLEIVTEHTKTD